MPNWCANVLQLSGTKEEIKEIADKLTAMDGSNFFDIWIPSGEDREDWYSYNLDKYGCKWNCEAADWDIDSGDGTTITITFDSPWGPPINLYNHITEETNLMVLAHYYEPGMCFAGVYDGGEEDYYDYSNMTSDEVDEALPAELNEMFCISEQLAEYEAENADEE